MAGGSVSVVAGGGCSVAACVTGGGVSVAAGGLGGGLSSLEPESETSPVCTLDRLGVCVKVGGGVGVNSGEGVATEAISLVP